MVFGIGVFGEGDCVNIQIVGNNRGGVGDGGVRIPYPLDSEHPFSAYHISNIKSNLFSPS